MTYFFETYGCQMNSAESAALELVLAERGWEKAAGPETTDLVLLNTCSVRGTAEKRALGRLAHYGAKKKRPAGKPFTLIVAGCMASRLGEKLKEKFPAVDAVMGTDARSRFPLILEAAERGEKADFSGDETPAFSFSASHLESGAFRSFVPIMHGCNNYCSYCVVPLVRGREISRSSYSIKAELALLAEKGVREITLLGQNVNSYRFESTAFPGLLRLTARAVEGTSIEWVRFLSANPGDLSEESIGVMAENRCFCRHLHLPLQHGSNRVLGAMKRRYTAESYLDLVEKLRRAMPDLSLSADLMVGFPGETEAELAELFALMEKVRFSYAYMYYYNPREGTAAWDMDGRIPETVKKERLARVIVLQRKHTLQLLQARVGKEDRVLVESVSRKNADELLGRTERDEMAVFAGERGLIGNFERVRLCSLNGITFRAVRRPAAEPPAN
ncbi:MAG: tRNA (N6-isopentenyl adenosine(37)-C2)-methylthiotransferase MiaB [Treponema sp.]|nr:tRNA (N6-isopentenyl adenosine(37)-C2)-methylthiotransferase MiaB [Treponema sp.]